MQYQYHPVIPTGSVLVANYRVSALSSLYRSPKSRVANTFDVAKFAVNNLRDIE
jgi:hypothetical protein